MCHFCVWCEKSYTNSDTENNFINSERLPLKKKACSRRSDSRAQRSDDVERVKSYPETGY